MKVREQVFVVLFLVAVSVDASPTRICFYHGLSQYDEYIQCGKLIVKGTSEKSEDVSHIHSIHIGWNTSMPVVHYGLFTTFKGLTNLFLDNAHIEAIETRAFYGMGQLEVLSFFNNKISSIEPGIFNQLYLLRVLNLGSNRIEWLDNNCFASLILLEQLSLKWNQLRHISKRTFTGLQRLRELNLDGNHIKALDSNTFENLHALEVLTLGFNGISVVPETLLSNLRNLSELSFESNQIQALPDRLFENTTHLQFLDLSNNMLTHLQEQILNHTVVEILKLDRNSISAIDAVSLLQHAQWLDEISIDFNPWNCDYLQAVVKELQKSQIYFERGKSDDMFNVHGIACEHYVFNKM